jgi:uncharacterized SAM-binding protein YcdF (DUF218 family)
LARKTQSGVLCWATAANSPKYARRMMYFLSKTVGRLIEPIGFIWLVLLIACVRAVIKKDRRQAFFTGTLALFITLVGSTKLPAYLLSTLERPYAVEDFSSLPDCDAVVLLGGSHEFSNYGVNSIEFGGATDRIITAAELVRLKKGEALVIGGGEYSSSGQTGLHGQLIAEWLESWKPFDSPIHVLGYSSNTKDEADQTKVLAEKNGWKKIILVTSANHMRRAEALFKKTGLEVVSVGSDFEGLSSLEADFRIYNIVPGSVGFDELSYYLHEQVGWLYYKLRGWI